MNLISTALVFPGLVLGAAQQHQAMPMQDLSSLSFLMGTWVGKQRFITGKPNPPVADITLTVSTAVGGRYLQEKAVVVLPNSNPTETLHLLTWDKPGGDFKSWWFNDTQVGPRLLEGPMTQDATDKTIVLRLRSASFSMGTASTYLTAIYTLKSPTELHYELHMTPSNAKEQTLFTIDYTKQP